MSALVNTHIIEPQVSPLVPQQFPAFYRDNYPLFIAFVQAYYQWLEQQPNPLYYTRNFLDLNDIDNTLNSFLVYFKEKYFKNIQLTTQADTRQLIKHALDIYRSKGTEREIKLLFQLLYNEQISFYYPKTDLFRLSDGIWEVPLYLELSLSENNVLLNQKEIFGSTSGAIAFIDSVIRRKGATSSLNDVAYVSGIIGNFQTGEKIIPTDGSLNVTLCPIVTGSLTTVVISNPGTTFNFNVGDLVNITSATGEGGKGRVTTISNLAGLLSFKLSDGGYAYTSGANCYVSNVMLTLNTATISNSYCQNYFKLFETITEPMTTINYANIHGGSFAVGDVLTAYTNSSAFSGNGTILTVNATSSSNGTLLVSTNSLRNLILDGNKFSTANWTLVNGATVTPNSGISPDGSNNAWLWQRSSTAPSDVRQTITKAASSLTYTFSLYGKPGTGNFLGLEMWSNLPNGSVRVTFNVSTGVISKAVAAQGAFSNPSATIQASQNGFYLCTVTVTSTTDTQLNMAWNGSSNNSDVDGSDSSATTNILGFGAQLLQQGDTSGTLNANLLFNQANVVSANLATSNGYTNSTATGQVIGVSNTTLRTISQNGSGFIIGEPVIQYWDNIGVGYNGTSYIGIANVATITPTLTLSGVRGIFRPNLTIYGLQSGTTANAITVINNVGVYNVNGVFNSIQGSYYTSDSSNGTILLASPGGNNAGFSIANNLQFTETVSWNSDQLQTYANVMLNATTYGFPANASINATANVIGSALSYANITVGKIGSVLAFNQGSGYNIPQFTLVYEPKSYVNQEFDNALYVTGMLGRSFNVGETITQVATNARGLVQFSNTSLVLFQNLRYNANNQFITTSNSTTTIVGTNSGFTANVLNIGYNQWDPVEGINAKIGTSTLVNVGAIANVEVVDSGFNFINGQVVQVGNSTVSATGIAFLLNQGSGTGFYEQKGGFTSDSKKLFDGFFWQEFSYQIISSQTIDKYEQTLKQLAHVAGIALFGRVVHTSRNMINVRANSISIRLPGSDYNLDFGLDFGPRTSATQDPLMLILLDII